MTKKEEKSIKTDEKQLTGMEKRLANLEKRKPLVKGFDPRRNLKGVPRDTIEMRKHMREIAAEIIGGDETAMTRLDALLRQLFTSRNPAHNKLALQVLDPKILIESTDITSNGQALGWKEYVEASRKKEGDEKDEDESV